MSLLPANQLTFNKPSVGQAPINTSVINHPKNKKRSALSAFKMPVIFCLASLAFIASFLFSLVAFSQFSLSLSDIWQLIFNQNSDSLSLQIIVELRLPRALVALLVGIAMSIAGLLMQGITRNPLASPSVFGVSAGAAFAFAFSATGLLPWLSHIPVVFITMTGALIAGVLVFFLGGLHHKNANPIRVILAGVALNYLCISMTRAAVIYADENAYGVMHWLIGSVSNSSFKDVHNMLPGTILGVVIAVFISHKLNLLRLGDEMLNSLGGNTQKLRIVASVATIVLIASAVSVAGPVGFIGLVVPHIARALIGQDFRLLLPLCALLGATLMLISDSFSRLIRFPDDSPVGIITSAVGALFFLLLALRQVRRTL
jgi:iron complex transport system permease protein